MDVRPDIEKIKDKIKYYDQCGIEIKRLEEFCRSLDVLPEYPLGLTRVSTSWSQDVPKFMQQPLVNEMKKLAEREISVLHGLRLQISIEAAPSWK